MTFHDRRPPSRRPRRSNTLKDIGDLLAAASTFYTDDLEDPSEGKKTRKRDRVAGSRRALMEAANTEKRAHAGKLNDTERCASTNRITIDTINVSLARYGLQFIANERVFHIHEDWPGIDRRRVSGSVWDGRKPLSDAPLSGPLRSFDFRLQAPRGQVKVRCAHRSWKSAEQIVEASKPVRLFAVGTGIGEAWLDDYTDAGANLRHLKGLALDRGAPVALARQGARESRSFLRADDGGAIGLGGATSQELKQATKTKANLNAEIMALRDLEAKRRPAPWQSLRSNPAYWSGKCRAVLHHWTKLPPSTAVSWFAMKSPVPLPCTGESSVFLESLSEHPSWPWARSALAPGMTPWERMVQRLCSK
jgi:hypothetical protein